MNQTRIIENPKKDHTCYACGLKITGRHIYNVSVIDGDFYYGRFHFKCDARINEMCGKCKPNNDCQSSLQDCFYETYLQEAIK